MLQEVRAKCAADGRWRERGVHLPEIHLDAVGCFFFCTNAAADRRLQTASGSGRGTDASFYSGSFLEFSHYLFLQRKVFERYLWSLEDSQCEDKHPCDCDGGGDGETPACIPLKQVSESTSAWHR